MDWLLQFFRYLIFYAALWWILSEGSVIQIWFGALIVMIAAALSSTRSPRKVSHSKSSRWKAALRFIPYFVHQSMKGGFLVAWFAVTPKLKIRSEYFDYRVRIPRDEAFVRMFFASCLCVFPGTLSCGYKGDVLVLHALDGRLIDRKAIRDLEEMLMAIFASRPAAEPDAALA